MDVAALHAEAKARYWKDKDLAAARRLLEEGISLARDQGDAGAEKPLQYDLASFCWPGWDEPGIIISPDDLRAGDQAARETFRLSAQVDKGLAGTANASFIVGAYELVAGKYLRASRSFFRQHCTAALDGDEMGDLLGSAYRLLALRLMGKDVTFGTVLARMRESGAEHAMALATQVETAGRVFGYTPGRFDWDPDERSESCCLPVWFNLGGPNDDH